MESKGMINAYDCIMGCVTITRNADSGTTPFMIPCPTCGNRAESRMYRVGHHPKPTHEWYRPSMKKARRLDKNNPGLLDHVRKGGLLLRTISVQTNKGSKRCA